MISNRILIVENNTINANKIRVAIESLGYEDIKVVYFGKEVFKVLTHSDPKNNRTQPTLPGPVPSS